MTTLKDINGTTLNIPGLHEGWPFVVPVRNEEWKYTNIKSRLPETLLLTTENRQTVARDFSGFSDFDAIKLTFTDGALKGHKSIDNDEMIVCAFSEARHLYPEIFEAYYHLLLAKSKENFIALNTAFAHDGYFIYVKKNAATRRPVIIQHHFTTAAAENFIQVRNLLICEEGSSIQVIEDHRTENSTAFCNIATEIFAAEDARVNYYLLQINSSHLTAINHYECALQRCAQFDFCSATFEGNVIRNNVHATLCAANAGAELRGLTHSTGTAHFDNHIAVNHHAPNCESHQLYKAILDNESTGVFNGKIFVEKDAQKTNAFQSSKAILLSEEASMKAKPQLEIFADDVKCSHGAAIGQINADELFYLKTRGLDETSAKNILTYAFASDVIATVKLPQLKAYLLEELQRHLGISL